IILSTKYHKHLGVIENIDVTSINSTFNMASAQELSFDIYKELDGKICSLWDSIVDFKYIFVPEFQEYYEIQISLDEDNKTIKHVAATSACEAELGTRLLRNFECNSEADILRDDYEPTVLYNPHKPDASLLDRVLKDKCPDYTIAHVDSSIASIQRTFSVDNENIYAFFTSTVAKEMECLFVFDSVNRAISVYDLKNACSECGHRFDDGNACPECGSENSSKKYGENTSVYISADNYAELITVEGNTDNVFNCFKIEGGDDLITATVANINPNGSNYIYQYQQDALNDMPENLVTKINEYNTLYNNKKPVYEDYTKEMYKAIDDELYLTSEMMPEIVIPETSASQELSNLLTQISEVAVANISVISKASSDIAVKGMAKVIVDARYDVEIISSSLSGLVAGTYRTWTGKFKIVNKGNEEDIAESTSLGSVKIVGNNYEEYLYQKIQKALDKEDSLFYSIFEIKDMTVFKTELEKYCLDRLKSFESSYQTCLEVLIENGVTDTNATFYDVDLYNSMYLPYYERILAIQSEMVVRERQISEIQAEKKKYDNLRKDIQK
ncbi:MAG: zinc ribbon domain-containing protein, partial [Lachnospiraceae bacterium]|nr:zinc ribbon domain-containing protein [Lachnospiraceae bacterium]